MGQQVPHFEPVMLRGNYLKFLVLQQQRNCRSVKGCHLQKILYTLVFDHENAVNILGITQVHSIFKEYEQENKHLSCRHQVIRKVF